MTDSAAILSFITNHIWQSALLAAVLAGLLAARGRLSAQMRHALAFAALVAAATLPLAMLLPGNDALVVTVSSSVSPASGAERVMPMRIDPARDTDPVAAPSLPAERAAPRPATVLPRTGVTAEPAWTPATEASPAPTAIPRDRALRLDVLQRPAVVWSLAAIWLTVAAVLLARTGFDIAAAERLRRRATPLRLPPSLAHLVGGHDVRESAEAPGPMVAGLLTPAIILPRGLVEQRGPQELIGLLEHERAHVERGDVPLALIQRILTALLWWSPAMHWIAGRVEEEREMACDEAAALRVGDARAFARVLTDHAEAQLLWGWPRLVVGAARSRSQLGRRVRRLLERAGSESGSVRVVSRASAAVLLAVIAATALATPRISAQTPDEPPAAPAAPAAPSPEARDASRAREALARAEADLARATEALAETRERAERNPSRTADVPRAERELRNAERNLERAQRTLAQRLAVAEAALPDAEDLAEATEELARAQDDVARAERQFTDAVEAMGDDPSSADEVREAAQELAEARRELRRAARELERAAVTVDVRGRDGAGGPSAGFSFDVRGPDDSSSEEVARAAEALAEAVVTMVGDFDLAFDIDPEAFAEFEKLEGLEGLEALKELEHLQHLPAFSFSTNWNGHGREDSPLMTAARMGNEEMVRLLVDAGADVNATTRGDGSVLMMAVRSGDAELVEYLLEAGADPDLAVSREGSPLMTAARMGDTEMVRLLIEAGADVNAEVPYEGTALTAAIRSGDVELVRLLIDLGADIEGASADEESAQEE